MSPPRPPASLCSAPRQFLLLQLRRIGDLILTTPAIEALQQSFPDARVGVLAMPSCSSLLPALTAQQAFVFGTREAQQALLFQRWDVCLDFTGSDRSATCALLSRARLRISFLQKNSSLVRRAIFHALVHSPAGDRHTVEHFLDLLSPLGISQSPAPPLTLRLPEPARTRAQQLLAELKITPPFAIIHPGSARPEKFWIAERWGEVAKFLAAHGHVILTGGTSPAELAHLRAIRAVYPPAHSLAGKTSLCELAALIQHASLFCGCDSAALHLAEAMGTPALALFGPTNPFHWQPRFAPHRILRANDAPPWTPKKPGGPLEDISTGEVLSALRELIACNPHRFSATFSKPKS